MRNKTANIYTEWLPLIDTLPDEQAGKVFKSILKYQNGEDIELKNPIWLFIKSKIDEYNNKLEEIKEKRRISGSYGGLAKASKCYQKLANDSKDKQNLPNLAIKENKIKENKTKQNNNIIYNYYGELKNVKLTEEEYNKLSVEHTNLDQAIEKLDTWLGTSGSKNKNKPHYAYFKSNSWVWDGLKTETRELVW
jgi:hypothetical protein